jgi:NADH-quinone oxidoreductase subunit G
MIVEYKYENQKENFEDVDSIVFSADITNEEAMIFQLLKENQGKRLICPEAKGYQDFLKAYSSSSGYHVFKGDLNTLTSSDIVISFGLWFQDENTEPIPLIRKTLEENRPKFVYMHPIEDAQLHATITQFIKYEVGSEEGVAALLAYTLLEDKDFSKEVKEILEDLDIGYLSAESNVGEEELESMYGLIDKESTTSLIIGSDLYTHPNVEQIAKLIAFLERYAGVNVVCIPPAQNALGVALICELDDVVQGKNIVYHSCKEGTYVNGDKCVYLNDKNESLDINGLNRLASILGLHGENLMEYSNQLPQTQGFKVLDEDIKDHCIYKLVPQERKIEFVLDEIDDLPVYDGALIYTYKVENPMVEEDNLMGVIYGSNQFAMATKLQDGDLISFELEGVKFKRVFKIDTRMKGVIALNPVVDIKLSAYLISLYRFSRLAFEKINNQKIGNNNE